MNLDRLLNPRTIAVIGGSQAELAIEQCDRLGYEGEIWPVHPTRQSLAGRPVHSSVGDLPGVPDAAFVGVNRVASVEVVAELASIGAGGAICYAAGFAETGPEGAELQRRLVDHDMPVIGPNCYGIINSRVGAALWPDVQGCRRTDRGVALVTQSGNIALNMTMNQRGLDFTHVVSLGNQASVHIEHCIAYFAADPAVVAIGVHAESIVDSRQFAAAALAAHAARKPIVMLKTGTSATAADIAASHTAALAKPADVYQALFDRYGVITVGSVPELTATLAILSALGPTPGNRMVSLSCSGGEASLVADRAARHDVVFERFKDEQLERVRTSLDDSVAISNPLDYHTFIWDDERALTECFTAVLDGPSDAAMLVLDWPAAGNNATTWWPTLRAIEAAHEATSTPTIVAASLPENMPSHAREHLAKRGVAAAYSIDEALAGVAATAAAGRWLATPAPRIHNAAQPAPRATRTIHEAAAKHVLDSAGIATPTGIVGDPATVVVEAASLRFPLVAKAAGIDHKSEVGAVHLGLASDAELRDAVTSLSRLGASVLVEEQVENTAVELLVSVRNEAPLGQVLVIGSGGTNVEIWADTITALLPVDEAEIADMLDGLMIAPLLRGHRGRPAVGVEPIAAVVEGLQDLLTARPDIVEIEINPLIVTRHGAVAVDALISVADSQEVSHG